MEQTLNYIDDVVPGKSDWKLRVRVNRMWTQPDRNNHHEVGTVEMIFVDEKFGKIQATIARQWFPKFMADVREGDAYIVENLMVGKNDKMFPKTEHKFKLNFMGITRLTTTVVDQIPGHVFDFLDFPSILGTKRSDIFIDVIGHVVEKNHISEKEIRGEQTALLDLVIEDLAQNRIRCALWGHYADQMQAVFDRTSPVVPIVVVLQMCRLNIYKGVGNISSAWYGTKLFINDDIPAIHDYRSRMVADEASLTQTVTQISRNTSISIGDELLNTDKKSISDLIEATETFAGCVLVDALEFDMSEGWAFNSCNTCFRNATKVGSGFTCKHCDKFVAATPRYKLNVVVIDDTGSTTFTLFNGLVEAIVGRSAVELLSSYAKRETLSDQPIEFQPMLGKKYLFKVEVSDGNIVKGYTTYTAKKFTTDLAVIQKFIAKHGMNVCTDEEDAEITHSLVALASQTPLIDLGDSPSPEKTNDYFAHFDDTPPTSKQLGKRPVADFDGIDLNNMDFSPESVKKLSKGSIKIEPKE